MVYCCTLIVFWCREIVILRILYSILLVSRLIIIADFYSFQSWTAGETPSRQSGIFAGAFIANKASGYIPVADTCADLDSSSGSDSSETDTNDASPDNNDTPVKNVSGDGQSEQTEGFAVSKKSGSNIIPSGNSTNCAEPGDVFSKDAASPVYPTNAIHIGRDRLLKLEDGIERRYLKPPLG